MGARFELGDPQHPRGHALVFFRSTTRDEILATYVVALPIAINPAKYVPPAFATRLPQQVSTVDVTALPPIPEAVGDLDHLRRLARLRGDDLLDGGLVEDDPDRLMMVTHEVAREYAERYQRVVQEDLAGADAEPLGESLPDEESLRWMLMDEKERIGELAKLTGQLRYAVDGGDAHLIASTARQIEKLKLQLPEKYRIAEFLTGAQRPGDVGRRLAELYIDRCYKLSNERYEDLAEIDKEIAALESA
jgi:hypothetical protein